MLLFSIHHHSFSQVRGQKQIVCSYTISQPLQQFARACRGQAHTGRKLRIMSVSFCCQKIFSTDFVFFFYNFGVVLFGTGFSTDLVKLGPKLT
jgi:hypothetical protein